MESLGSVAMSPFSPKTMNISSFLLDDDTSRDSGYGSPDMALKPFSLETPESTPPPASRVSRRSFSTLQVKRSLVFNKRSRDQLDSADDSPLTKRCRTEEAFNLQDCMTSQGTTELDTSEIVTSEHMKKALDKMQDDGSLVGDGSKTHGLPTVQGRHKDLKTVTSHTVSGLLAGDYNDVISDFKIIDCRYPYEYVGGHIEGAVNLHTEALINDFITSRKDNSCSRTVLIFHCEFSSERGPKLMRHLRSEDRKLNAENYPFLFYPEVYLLEGGYKNFFENNKCQCQPQTYLPMLHNDYVSQLRHFRSVKSRNGKEKKRAVSRRLQVQNSPCSFAF